MASEFVHAGSAAARTGRSAASLPRLPGTESFTRIEFALAVDVPISDARIASKRPRRTGTRRYGKVPVFTLGDLNDKQREALNAAFAAAGCNSIQALLQKRATEATKPPFVFEALPARLQTKAHVLRDVLDRYCYAVDCGEEEKNANRLARSKWLFHFEGAAADERTIRRRAARVAQFGGPSYAPLLAYIDQKSVPHDRRSGKELTAEAIIQQVLRYSHRLSAIAKADVKASEKIEAAALSVFGMPLSRCRELKLVTGKQQST